MPGWLQCSTTELSCVMKNECNGENRKKRNICLLSCDEFCVILSLSWVNNEDKVKALLIDSSKWCNLKGDDIRTIERNTDMSLITCKDIGLVVKTGKIKYIKVRHYQGMMASVVICMKKWNIF